MFIGSGSGTLYAFEPGEGEEVWTYDIDSAITSSPTVFESTVYVGANDGTVHAVDTDGSVAWSQPAVVGGPVYSAVDAADGRVFVTTIDGALVALDAETGDEEWSLDTGTRLGAGGPTVSDGTVYVGADAVYAVDATAGDAAWDEPADYGGTAGSTPTVTDDVVYVGDADGQLYALDATGGSELWSYEVDAAIASDPAVADGRVAVASLAGTLYLLEDDGTELASATVDDEVRSSPVLSELTVVVGSEGGQVFDFAIDEEH